jgi:hypothetical protein
VSLKQSKEKMRVLLSMIAINMHALRLNGRATDFKIAVNTTEGQVCDWDAAQFLEDLRTLVGDKTLVFPWEAREARAMVVELEPTESEMQELVDLVSPITRIPACPRCNDNHWFTEDGADYPCSNCNLMAEK